MLYRTGDFLSFLQICVSGKVMSLNSILYTLKYKVMHLINLTLLCHCQVPQCPN